MALFSEVYTNPAVPGFIRDKAYDLAGRRVGAASLPRGVYIRVRGGKSEKIII